MAIYHLSFRSLKAGSGRSAVQHASYISGETLKNERLGVTFAEKKSKGYIAYSELSLPENVNYSRAELWNFVEDKITIDKQNQAKYGDIALPKEWTLEQCKSYARELMWEVFVSKGYAVDWAIHIQDGNPHIDFMVTSRAFLGQDKFAPNSKSMYANTLINGKPGYDPNIPTDVEYRIPVIDKKTGTQKIGARNRKMWHQVKIENEAISSRPFLYNFRQSWQDIANAHLAPEDWIDCRSYAARGIEKVPGEHHGNVALAIESREEGTSEVIGRINEEITEKKARLNFRQKMEALKRQYANVLSEIVSLREKLAIQIIAARKSKQEQPAPVVEVKPYKLPTHPVQEQGYQLPKPQKNQGYQPTRKHSDKHKGYNPEI